MMKRVSIFTVTALISMAGLTWLQGAFALEPELEVKPWNPPLDAPIKLVNQYRQPNSDYSAGHRGIDYLAIENQRILSPADGQVSFVGLVVNRNLISIRHQNGLQTEYEPVCSELKLGQRVSRGQQIGWLCQGQTNYDQHCDSADCLHFSLRKNGAYLSPLVQIGGMNPSRLLPFKN